MQVNHILPKPHQHLRRRLPSDTSVDIGLTWKEHAAPLPPVLCHRCPIEHHSIFARSCRGQRLICLTVVSQLRPISQLCPHRGNLFRSRGIRRRSCYLCPVTHSHKRYTSQQKNTRKYLHHVSPLLINCVPILAILNA